MWVGNVGDSRAVIARTDSTLLEMTEDHKVSDPREQERIIEAGGEITEQQQDEAARVVCYSEAGTKFALAMSRSIGDLRFTAAGVSHEPEVTFTTLADEDEWLIMATDGIWEFITNQEAAEIVRQHDDATMACRSLIARAKQLWLEEEGDYRDDITVTVVKLQVMLNHVQASTRPVSRSPSRAQLTLPTHDKDSPSEYQCDDGWASVAIPEPEADEL